MGEEKYTPIKKFGFPAGDCGGEIRITVPVYATKEEVLTAAEAFKVVAERWKNKTA